MSRFSPPSAAAVVNAAPMAVAALAAPIAALAAATLAEKLSKEEKEEQKEEADRRAALVRDMVKSLEKQEAMKQEEAEKKVLEKKASKKLDTVNETDQGTAGESPNAASEDNKGEAEQEEEDPYDDVGNMEFGTLRERCMELATITPGATELEDGVRWCGKLLLKEMKIAITKTEAQKDVRYSDGQKLEELLECPINLDGLAKEARQPVPKELREEIRQAYYEAERATRKRKRRDIMKGMKMILLAKSALPWVLASNTVSTLATTISTMALHYRAEVLQALRVSTSSNRKPFFSATKAMVVVELVAALFRTLESQLNGRVNSIMAKSIQVKLFMALMNKDTVWWSEQKNPFEHISNVMGLPYNLKDALQAPQTILNTITSVTVQAALVRQKSSKMLYAMITLHWAKYFVRKAMYWLSNQLHRLATRSLVMPSQDKFTWVYAINPEFVQMYQSFARGSAEATNLLKFMSARNRSSDLSTVCQTVTAPMQIAVDQAANIAEYMSMGSVVEQGIVDLTQAETMMHYATQVGSSIEGAYHEMSYATDSFAPLARAYDLISIPPKIDPNTGVDPGERSKGHFKFENVEFGYPGRKKLLHGVTFEVSPGQVVGITGETGCGKSTTLRLVERFYDVTAGRILLDGRDIREYSPLWLRSQIVAVAQEPKLLPLSIRDNLTFGCLHRPSMEEIETACRSANIWDVLMDPRKFPNGLETRMNMMQNVAGGEKQRICIARAILANPPILLLDEATSALDELSQAHVQEALNKLMKGRTTLVVAHRLSTIKDSDKIIGMKDGKVVDDGTHAELLKKKDGVWRKLWDKSEGTDSSPKPEAEAPMLLPSLQRTTTSKTHKYDVLRQALASLVETKDVGQRQEGVDHIMGIIDELEASAVEEGQAQEADKNAANPPSKWTTLRNARRLASAMGGIGSAGVGTTGPRALTLQRGASKDRGALEMGGLGLERAMSSATDKSLGRAQSTGIEESTTW